MAAPNNSSCWSTPEVYKHHEQGRVCASRPKYREGRRPKAVKVYTINLESRFLMVQGVPAIGVMTELVQLCALYGVVEEYRPLDEYPAEEFTEVYLIKFNKLSSARAAKRRMDEKSFFGGILHVCYAPEYETVEDTRQKLQYRRCVVRRITQNKAKEQEQVDEESRKSTPSNAVATSVTTSSRNDQRQSETSDNQGSSTTSYSLGFPLLPLPPQEHSHYRHVPSYNQPFENQANQSRMRPTEDKMGSLHYSVDTKQQHPLSSSSGPTEDKMGSLHYSVDTKQQHPLSSSSGPSSSNGDKGTVSRLSKNLTPVIRFLPRTTHLENRKHKMLETSNDPLFGIMGKSEPLIGPQLPEQPKMDMEDKSMNTTANLIRHKMTKAASIPEVKPAEKKKKTTTAKPRRRI